MEYTLHQLEIFKKVAELQSVTRASEALFLTQPAISIQLKKLQDQFPQPLFEVIGRQLYITDFGKEVANYVEKILNEVEALNTRTLTFNGQLAGKLKVALVSTAKYVMPYFLTDFIQENSGVTLSIDVTNKATVLQSLEKNQVDFALVSVIPDNLKIKKISLMKNKMFLVGGKQFKNQKTNISQKKISQLPMLFRENGSATRQIMEKHLKSQGIPLVKRLELTSNEAIKQAIIAGLGFSIMPLIGIKNELETGDIQIIPAKGLPITTNWNLIWLQSKKLSPTAEAFTNFIEQKKQDIIDNSFDWFEKY
ncbi:MAG: LysR family transcriptional regulator [Saprospiraceae bacterium]|nr:LysR family transcriptional regulator [Saprospiraceae bacterium]